MIGSLSSAIRRYERCDEYLPRVHTHIPMYVPNIYNSTHIRLLIAGLDNLYT